MLSRLDHPNIVQYKAAWQEGRQQFIAMEYCEVGAALGAHCSVLVGDGALTVQGEHSSQCPATACTSCRDHTALAAPTPPAEQGGDLEGLLKARAGALLPEGEAMLLFVQLLLALQHVHGQVRG